jgi:hypothetical protein
MISTRAATMVGAAVLLALLFVGCTRQVSGVAIGRQDITGAGNACTAVSAPLTPIPTQAEDEPRMLIPQPSGWQRTTMRDSEYIRFVMVKQSLTANDFASSVVVSLQSKAGRIDPTTVFDNARHELVTNAGATDLVVTDGTVCGHPAQTIHYTEAATGRVAAHPGTLLTAVVHTTGKTYAADVTIITTNDDHPAYQRAAETILTGFQLLAPAG